MGELVVKALTDDECERWDTFVRGGKNGTFFHLSAWRAVMEEEFGCTSHYIYAEADDQIVGVLPLCHVRNFIVGSALMSSPFLVYGGVIADDRPVEEALAREARSIAEKLRVDYLELRNRWELAGNWVTKHQYVTFRKELASDVDENLNAIPRKQRAMVRKAMKFDLETCWKVDIDRFYSVFSESYRNLGTPVFGKSLISKICSTFSDQIWMTTILEGGRPLSSVLTFLFRDEVLPYYGGGGSMARNYAANDYMYWAVMERAASEGFKVFDYGRSKVDSGSYRFKKHWGFQPEVLSYQYHLVRSEKPPDLSPANPKYRLPIELWKRLPVGLSRIVGPPIARRLA